MTKVAPCVWRQKMAKFHDAVSAIFETQRESASGFCLGTICVELYLSNFWFATTVFA